MGDFPEASGTANYSDAPETETKNRPKFGNRYLMNREDVFKHNAWDNVQWDETQEQEALDKIAQNSTVMVPEDKRDKYDSEASLFWDKFYQCHQDKFFKDRHWLFTEFPELDKSNTIETTFNILEVGCGVGNTVIPILEGNLNKNVHVYCCDFSETAVNLVKKHPTVSKNSTRCQPFVCDITENPWSVPFECESLDAILLIFVLSAINPTKMKQVLIQASSFLKPGGVIFFRDYGRYDMAQLRFKNGSCLTENFYVRGDGTQVYFFEKLEVDELFAAVGFEKVESVVDRRLQVNRGKRLTMYRIWVQGKYRKI